MDQTAGIKDKQIIMDFTVEKDIITRLSIKERGELIMRKTFLSGLAIGLLVLSIAGIAGAIPLTLTFEATGFSDSFYSPGSAAPQSTVSGTIVYEASSLGGLIQSLTSIDMTINGNAYSVGDIGYTSTSLSPGSWDKIYGSYSGENIGLANNDFILQFYRGNAAGDYQSAWNFAYSTSGDPYTFWTASEYELNITDGAAIEPVPEPATILLFGLGLLGLAGVNRRQK